MEHGHGLYCLPRVIQHAVIERMDCVHVDKDETEESCHQGRPGVNRQMKPVRLELSHCWHFHILAALHYLLWELWNRKHGEQTISWNGLRCLRVATAEPVMNPSIGIASRTLLTDLVQRATAVSDKGHVALQQWPQLWSEMPLGFGTRLECNSCLSFLWEAPSFGESFLTSHLHRLPSL
jgi:hypothetical protein